MRPTSASCVRGKWLRSHASGFWDHEVCAVCCTQVGGKRATYAGTRTTVDGQCARGYVEAARYNLLVHRRQVKLSLTGVRFLISHATMAEQRAGPKLLAEPALYRLELYGRPEGVSPSASLENAKPSGRATPITQTRHRSRSCEAQTRDAVFQDSGLRLISQARRGKSLSQRTSCKSARLVLVRSDHRPGGRRCCGNAKQPFLVVSYWSMHGTVSKLVVAQVEALTVELLWSLAFCSRPFLSNAKTLGSEKRGGSSSAIHGSA